MSQVPAIDRIALAEVRLLKEAQKGNPGALSGLLEPYLSGIWSICRGFFGADDPAMDAVVRFRDAMTTGVKQFAHDRAFGLQLYGALWRHMLAEVEPQAVESIPTGTRPVMGKPLRPRGDDARIVYEVLSVTRPLPRLIYLFWVVTDLEAGRLSELIGIPEGKVREARADVTTRMQEAMSQ